MQCWRPTLCRLGCLALGKVADLATEVRVLRQLGQFHPRLNLFRVWVVGQLRGHRAGDPRERGVGTDTAEGGGYAS